MMVSRHQGILGLGLLLTIGTACALVAVAARPARGAAADAAARRAGQQPEPAADVPASPERTSAA